MQESQNLSLSKLIEFEVQHETTKISQSIAGKFLIKKLYKLEGMVFSIFGIIHLVNFLTFNFLF